MGPSSLFIVGLVGAVVVLVSHWLAERLRIPEAIPLVLLGAAVAFVPGMPDVHLPPQAVLLGFLPPLVYYAAFFTAPREAKADAVPIIILAFGLTVVTTFAVAATAHSIMSGLGWGAAIAFGAAIAPTDAVSATSILQRLSAPPRIVTILESESLINDGVALTAFGLALEALTTTYTTGHGLMRLGEVVCGGVAYGLVVGFAVSRLRRRIRDPRSQLIVSLLTPYLAYVPATDLGFSGVLATVVAGFYLGTRGEGMLQPASRLPGRLFWRTLIFLLESALFVLLGLQGRAIINEMAGHTWRHVIIAGIAVSVVVVAVRLAWALFVFPVARYLPGRHLDFDHMSWRERIVVGWSGMRGAISLAIILSLPVTVHGTPLKGRDEVIFLVGVVVFATLVGQATMLPALLGKFGMTETDRDRIERMKARRSVIETALGRIDEMTETGKLDERTSQTFRQMYEDRLERVRAELDDEPDEDRLADTSMVRREIVRAQRDKLRRLYGKGRISAGTRRAVERSLDLDDPDIRRGVG
jgi:Na+/H+ antiporter